MQPNRTLLLTPDEKQMLRDEGWVQTSPVTWRSPQGGKGFDLESGFLMQAPKRGTSEEQPAQPSTPPAESAREVGPWITPMDENYSGFLTMEKREEILRAGWVQHGNYDWASPEGWHFVDTPNGVISIYQWTGWVNDLLEEAHELEELEGFDAEAAE